MKRRYDLKPSKPVPEAIPFKYGFMPIPPVVDLTGLCSPIQDQGPIGSCTSHAMSGMLEFLELGFFRQKISMQPEEFAGVGLQHPSRLFIYYNERLIEGTTQQDVGASISDSVRSVVQYGFCNENIWLYDISKVLIEPQKASYDQALRHRASSYRQLGLNDLLPCLASGYPFIIGFQVYSSFESPQVSATGIMPMPQWGDQHLGGHAVLVVGYDIYNQQFIVRNSWGVSWGMGGYFRMPFQYLSNPQLASDFWTIVK